MSSPLSLNELSVLVTRPGERGLLLCDEIDRLKGRSLYAPTIVFSPPDNLEETLLQMQMIDQYDWVIFTSPEAVKQALTYLAVDLRKGVAAIGEGTAKALRAHHICVETFPKQQWNSEGLLALEAFKKVEDKKIAVIKGQGGRELLVNELRLRGATVTEIAVYKRNLPQQYHDEVANLLRMSGIDVIICTSVEGVYNLKKLYMAEWELLKKIPLLVISERIQQKTHQLGFEKTILADNANNQAIINVLLQVRKTGMDNQNTLSKNATKPEFAVNPKKPFPWKIIGILFSSLALLILLGLFYITNIYYSRIASDQSRLNAHLNQVNQQTENVDHRVNELADQLASQQQVLTTLQQTQTGFNRNEWLILEAEFLVKLANDKLQYERNVPQAIQLLQAADKEIGNLNDANLLPVRKSLADDIANLQTAEKTDIAGIYLQLAAINSQLDKLPLINKALENQANEMKATQNLPWWKKGLLESWHGLKQIVVVRYHASGKPPLVLPNEQVFLYMNLHAEMEKSMWALVHQQPEIYKMSLQQLIIWVKEYFVAQSSVTEGILENLSRLQDMNVKPAIPNVSSSLQAFQDYFAARKQ